MRHAVRRGHGALIVQVAALAQRLEPHVRVEVPKHVGGLPRQYLLQLLIGQPTVSDVLQNPAGCTDDTNTLFLGHRWLSGIAAESHLHLCLCRSHCRQLCFSWHPR